MKRIIAKNGLILGLFAVLTSGLIALTYFGTQAKIEQQRQQTLLAILDELVPRDAYNNVMQQDCVLITSMEYLGSHSAQKVYRATLDGKPVASVFESTAPDGYSGRIKLVVGILKDSSVSGVRVLEHKETPGLGDKIDLRISDWILDFNGRTLSEQNAPNWAVRKDGGQFDQFTGATITPRAVVNAVKRTVTYYQANKEAIFSAASQCPTATKGSQL